MSSARYETVPGDSDAAHQHPRGAEVDDDDDDPVDDSEEDDGRFASRTSADIRRHDLETLTAEEEAERLLASSGGAPAAVVNEKQGWRKNIRRHEGRKSRLRRTTAREGGAETELLYKVEEGGRSSSSASSENSSELDLRNLNETLAKRHSHVLDLKVFAGIGIGLVVAFLAMYFTIARMPSSRKGDDEAASTLKVQTLSNGTHDFAPTTILVSLDGFRADFLYRGLTPTLSAFIQQGVSPKYMLPSFPSLTFPNHFTIVTGLYPESHGIVGNTFWDPNTQKEFYYTDPARSMVPEWWQGEPLWETAELQGIRSAIHMWPGSEAHIGTKEPTYVDKFDADEPLDEKVGRILGWLDLPGVGADGYSETPRPQLIAAYVPNVDADGHAYGPNSTYIRSTIAEVDGMLEMLFQGIDERNLTDIVNIVVVSDHGMATTSNHRLIQLEDLIDTSLIEHTDGWPLYGLRPFDHSDEHIRQIYQTLLAKAESPEHAGHFDVYLRDENMPERYHFSKNDRIAPLWIVPQAGWAIVTKDEFHVATALQQGLTYYPRGLHGYDHEHPLMRAIFVARGPAFPHPKGSQVAPFQNLEVYNIVCDSLGLAPRPNNGSLRLPLKPIGLHATTPPDDAETPDDPADDPGVALLLPPAIPVVSDLPTATAAAAVAPSDTAPSSAPPADSHGPDAPPKGSPAWVEWFRTKYQDVKIWALHLFDGTPEEVAAEIDAEQQDG